MALSYNGSGIWQQSSRFSVNTPIPTVKIINVDIPSVVKVGQTYNYNATLNNTGAAQAIVTLRIVSSLAGLVSNTSITIPAGSTINVPLTTAFSPAGARTVTYTVLYNDQVIDSFSKNIQANP
jgi:hypothetical protein